MIWKAPIYCLHMMLKKQKEYHLFLVKNKSSESMIESSIKEIENLKSIILDYEKYYEGNNLING